MKSNHADYNSLSPFELKDLLIDAGSKNKKGNKLLNAGRGNPNFTCTIPRRAFHRLGLFAIEESEYSFSYLSSGIGGVPKHDGIVSRLEQYCIRNEEYLGISFIKKALSYIEDQLGIDREEFTKEIVEAILGCNYPVPPRMLALTEEVVKHYLIKEMGCNQKTNEFDLFAVEGGTAAMRYIFDSMKQNFILEKGDSVAIGVPAFTPYMEIPLLKNYSLNEIHIKSSEENGWQYTDEELNKLLDPNIKVFFCINPSNPASVKLDDRCLNKIAEIVSKHPDLIILTDDVYGTFANKFTSLFSVCPYNTILVYSYSKYFGATGWRLGTIAINKNNVIDDKIKKLNQLQHNELHDRYASLTKNVDELKFIDRLVADSRAVALNHTAGLSTPQQIQMLLFSIFSLMDVEDKYKTIVKTVIERRDSVLYKELGGSALTNNNIVGYYTLLDLVSIASKLYNKDYGEWIQNNINETDFIFNIAEKYGVVLLPGKGFGSDSASGRVSLANLNEVEYAMIGKVFKDELDYIYNNEYMKSSK
ncbi:bifunctional aspartate transaminase/aspartate 4-decarboxylase [Obesumbacterium proteus]|uniref:Aminotransferase n=1 Tax=Obesumbacterium proteus ATCC 12841 TaxID=1354268 RepID=A0AA91EF75_9GAMM|nr:bifunctional aspartate transaminase/aspartate 4-decarboxylase [Obesumbacterium proteus]OAT56616.1 aspartate/tyrosine/aromatic aminotransferase [Obesumbacterium proteus ATCC 12841]